MFSMIEKYIPIMNKLTRARNPFELRYFVIGKQDNRMQQYRQAIIEMDAKHKALEEAHFAIREKNIKLKKLARKLDNTIDELDIDLIEIKIERINAQIVSTRVAMEGALKEVVDFIAIIEREFSDFLPMSEEELNEQEVNYWIARFAKQVHIDLLTSGIIGAGNRAALESMPIDVQDEILQTALLQAEERKAFEGVAWQKAQAQLQIATCSLTPSIKIQSGAARQLPRPEGRSL